MKGATKFFYWAARVIAALIMLQTLYFKFSGSAESVEIFTRAGMEPWGRIGVGVLELVASALVLVNATAWIGSVLGLGLMTGAIAMHLGVLGISVRNDGGYLFFLALVVFACCLFILLLNRRRVLSLAKAAFK